VSDQGDFAALKVDRLSNSPEKTPRREKWSGGEGMVP